jgi:hypothetical protein
MKMLRILATRLVITAVCLGLGSAQAATTLLYAVSGWGTTDRVTAFDPNSSGIVAPILTIPERHGALSLTFDPALRLYTQFFNEADIFMYPPNAHGNVAPIFTAFGSETSANGIAVDSRGYIFTLSGLGANINGYAPGATSPFITIPCTNSYAWGIAVDDEDNVIVTTLPKFGSNGPLAPYAVKVFSPRLETPTPIRTISGANTALGGADSKVSFSKLTGRIYVSYSGGGTAASKVLVFEKHANGNVAPLRVITGAATGLGMYITGVVGNPITGEIFVLSSTRDNAAVTVYPQLANGNVAPVRAFTDPVENFGTDIAFSPAAAYSVNAGGAATTDFNADTNFTGGTPITWTNGVDTSLLVGIAPTQNVLRSDREGKFTYKFTGLTPVTFHTLTMYFVENYFSAPNQRLFSLSANGSPLVVNLDIFAEAGAKFKAIQHSALVYSDVNGEILIQATATKDQAKIGAILVN